MKLFALFLAVCCSREVFAEAGKGSLETLEATRPITLENSTVEALSEDTELARDSKSLNKEEILALIHDAEKKHSIPIGLLKSIAHVESGCKQYYLNIAGKTIRSNSAKEAIQIANQELSEGRNNIDLGVMQVNLRWHGKEFKSLEQMIEPQQNIEYAAKLLSSLNKQHGSWHKAVRHYHSANPEHHKKYSRKVLLSWIK